MEERKQKVRNLSFEKDLFEEIQTQNQQKTEKLLEHLLRNDPSRRHPSLLHFMNNRRKVLTKVSIQPALERKEMRVETREYAESNGRKRKTSMRVGVDLESLKNTSTNSFVPSLEPSAYRNLKKSADH